MFDLDGTLVDSALDIAAALSTVSRARGGDAVSAATVRPLVSLGAATMVARALGPAARESVEDVAAFRTVLSAAVPDPRSVYAGVERALDRLTAQGWRLAIVTNKPEGLAESLLAGLGLRHWFAAVVGGDTAGVAKPDPAPVRHALAALGATPADAVFVGDSGIDAAAAAALAIPLIVFAGGYGVAEIAEAQSVARFVHHDQLPGILARYRG
nr:HAD-IA family hydrolase [Sphingomonas yunnanensis]